MQKLWRHVTFGGDPVPSMPGDIISMATIVVPEGFLEADGSSLSTTLFAELFTSIGYKFGGSGASFNIPDLRGVFLRGTDEGAGVDLDVANRLSPADKTTIVGDTVGSYRGHIIQSHAHIPIGSQQIMGWNYNEMRSGIYSGPATSPVDVRPINVYLMYCMRYAQ